MNKQDQDADASPPSHVGDRIRAARKQRDMTQADLAAAVGVSRSAVAQWETARAGQDSGHLRRIAEALEVGFEYLLRGDPAHAQAAARTGDEIALLQLYREAEEGDRQLILLLARRLRPPAD